MDNQSDIHTRLKGIRIQKGYTQEEIANKLNVSRQAVSRWETGKSCPDIENLALLGEIYGVSVDELLGKERTGEEEKKGNKFDREIVGMLLVLGVGFIQPVFGLIMAFCVLGWMIKRKKLYKTVIIAIIISLLFNVRSLYMIMSIKNGDDSESIIEKVE